jgi:hypothetical protein
MAQDGRSVFAWDPVAIPNRDSWLDRIERLLKQAEGLLRSYPEQESPPAEAAET